MHWVIRWTDEATDRDLAVVVEADTREQAKAVAVAQGVPVFFIARASQCDLADARRARLLLTAANTGAAVAHAATAAAHAAGTAARYTVLGHPLGHGKIAALMLVGVGTALLNLAPLLRPLLG